MDAAADRVVGREEELASITRWLHDRDSLPGVLVLEGEPGIGKTTLWRQGVELAAGASYRLLSSSPSQPEARLPYTVLGDLLDPVQGEVLETLPKPQRRALEGALFLEEPDGGGDPSPDQRAIALAFLGAIRTLSDERSLVIAIDDLQWLDEPSAFVLEFVLRRLHREPVAVLCGLRSGEQRAPIALDRASPQGRLTRIVVGSLSVGAVQRLLSDRLGLVLSRPKLRRLQELSGGNPFFALELGRAAQRGAIQLEAAEPLPGTLHALVQDRLSTLTPEARASLLVVAALSHPTLELVRQALGHDPGPALASAVAGDMIVFHADRIRFTHPLLASAVYAAADAEERRTLHRALAGLIGDVDEQAHHLAFGTEGPDAGVATTLEDVARRARIRGALTVATELSEHARRLTPPDRTDDQHRRTILAASNAFEVGESSEARALLEAALADVPPGPSRAELLYWLANVGTYEGDRRESVDLFERALAEAGDDLSLRARLEADMADALFLLRADLPAAAKHARSAVASAEGLADRSIQILALGVHGLTDAIVGGREWRDALARGISLEGPEDPVRLVSTSSFCLAVNYTWADQFDEARAIFHSLRARAAETAEDSALPWILAHWSLVEAFAGRWEEGTRLAQEAYGVGMQVGQEPQRLFSLGVRALLRASQGDADGARADAADVRELAERNGVMIAAILASSALGLLELSLEHPAATHEVLGPLVERLEAGGVREPGSARFIPDEIEALIILGRLDEAEPLLLRLERRARRLDRVSALAAANRCRGLLHAARGDLNAAIASLEGALVQHERVSIPFERARTLLVLGATRRRARMKRPAREALEESLGTFEGLGAVVWSGRARSELARIGGRRPSTGELTPTERRIAQLAAEGNTDKEIAAALYVTPKTVGTQLSRIYRKRGVRSRTELASAMRGDADVPKKAPKVPKE